MRSEGDGTRTGRGGVGLGRRGRHVTSPVCRATWARKAATHPRLHSTNSDWTRGCSRRHRVRPVFLQVPTRPLGRLRLQIPGSSGTSGVSVDVDARMPGPRGRCQVRLDPPRSAGAGRRLHHRRDARADGGRERRPCRDDGCQVGRQGGFGPERCFRRCWGGRDVA